MFRVVGLAACLAVAASLLPPIAAFSPLLSRRVAAAVSSTRLRGANRERDDDDDDDRAERSLPFPGGVRTRPSRIEIAPSASFVDHDTPMLIRDLYRPEGGERSPVDVPAALREPAYRFDVDVDSPPKKRKISKLDASLSLTLFCSILCTTFSSVLLPSVAREFSPSSPTAFVAAAAGVAPIGAFLGKSVNGFACERFGGREAGMAYMFAMGALCGGLAAVRSGALVPVLLAGLEFASGIQWTAACALLAERSDGDLSESIGTLSAAMAVGALVAKLSGAALLPIWPWRRIAMAAAVASLVGGVSLAGLGKGTSSANDEGDDEASDAIGPIRSAKNTLKSGIFWKVGIAHCIGYLVLGYDILLGSFIGSVSGLSGPISAGLSSSVALGFVHGMRKGRNVRDKTGLIRGNYRAAVGAAFGLSLLGMSGVRQAIRFPFAIAGLAAGLSGLLSSCVAFQYFQIPNLVSRVVFSKHSSVSMSLMDAVACLVTAQVLSMNRFVLSKFGWSASWMLLAGMIGLGGSIMNGVLPVVLRKEGETATVVTPKPRPRVFTALQRPRAVTLRNAPQQQPQYHSDEYLFRQVFFSRA